MVGQMTSHLKPDDVLPQIVTDMRRSMQQTGTDILSQKDQDDRLGLTPNPPAQPGKVTEARRCYVSGGSVAMKASSASRSSAGSAGNSNSCSSRCFLRARSQQEYL